MNIKALNRFLISVAAMCVITFFGTGSTVFAATLDWDSATKANAIGKVVEVGIKNKVDVLLKTADGHPVELKCEVSCENIQITGSSDTYVIILDPAKEGFKVGNSFDVVLKATSKQDPNLTLQGNFTAKVVDSPTGPAATTTGAGGSSNNGSSFIPKKPDGYTGPLPDCAFDGSCRNVNDLLELMVKWGERIFGLIGSLALVMFVYGGFVMIFSAGNADKVKKGRDILVAAVVGLIIAFSAYLLIDFILDALRVSDDFRGVKL